VKKSAEWSFVPGHDFSRADNVHKMSRASAPVISTVAKLLRSTSFSAARSTLGDDSQLCLGNVLGRLTLHEARMGY
jgi:hypothetical protein